MTERLHYVLCRMHLLVLISTEFPEVLSHSMS